MGQLGIPLNGYKYDASTASRFLYGFTTGVFSADNDLKITPGAGMSVIVSPGAAHLTPFQFLHCVYTNDEPIALNVGLAPQFMPEYRRVVVRWEITVLGLHPYLYILAGTPATNPAPPAITRSSTVFEISIGRVRIPPGTLQITQAMIEDERLDENVCGVTSSSISKIPTQALYDAWWSWFSGLKNDAETKATQFIAWANSFIAENESSFIEWITSFKATRTSEFDFWLSDFQSESTRLLVLWRNAFIAESEDDFSEWFAELRSTLDGDQAGALFNKIDNHERVGIDDSADGVHNLRLHDGKFQVWTGIGWATIGTVPFGFVGAFFNAQNFTGMSFNLRQFSGYSFNNVIRTEVE